MAAGAEDRQYRMPNANIPKLHRTGSPEQKAMVQNLLGVPGFDEKTGTGFSCFNGFNSHPKGISGQP